MRLRVRRNRPWKEEARMSLVREKHTLGVKEWADLHFWEEMGNPKESHSCHIALELAGHCLGCLPQLPSGWLPLGIMVHPMPP